MDVPLGVSLHLDFSPDRPPYGLDLQGPILEFVSELGQRDNLNLKTLSTVALVQRKSLCG